MTPVTATPTLTPVNNVFASDVAVVAVLKALPFAVYFHRLPLNAAIADVQPGYLYFDHPRAETDLPLLIWWRLSENHLLAACDTRTFTLFYVEATNIGLQTLRAFSWTVLKFKSGSVLGFRLGNHDGPGLHACRELARRAGKTDWERAYVESNHWLVLTTEALRFLPPPTPQPATIPTEFIPVSAQMLEQLLRSHEELQQQRKRQRTSSPA